MKKLITLLTTLALLGGTVVSAQTSTAAQDSFTIDFKVSSLTLDVNSDGALKENFSLLDSTDGVMSLYVPKGQVASSGQVYFRIYGARFTPLMVSQSIEDVVTYENIIAVDKTYKEVRWYILDENGKIDNDKTQRVYLLKFNGSYADIDTIKESYSPFGGMSGVEFSMLEVKAGALNQDVLIACKKIGQKDGNSFDDGSLKVLADSVKYLSDTVSASDREILLVAYDLITKGELDETEQSMNKLKSYIECARVYIKNKTNSITPEELDYFAKNTQNDDIYELLAAISDGGISRIIANIKSSNSTTYSSFVDAVREQIIINSITNASAIDNSAIAKRIIEYSSALGINLNGFDKLKSSAQNEVVAKLIAAKPTSVSDINSALKKATSSTTTAGNTNKGSGGGGGGGGGGASTTTTVVVPSTNIQVDETSSLINYLVAPFTLTDKDKITAILLELIKK